MASPPLRSQDHTVIDVLENSDLCQENPVRQVGTVFGPEPGRQPLAKRLGTAFSHAEGSRLSELVASFSVQIVARGLVAGGFRQELLWYIGVNRSAGLLKKTVASLGEAYLAV
jgi:hypothetical protein